MRLPRFPMLLRLAAVGVLLVLPSSATADPITVVDPNGGTASVTLSDSTVHPGQRVYLSGTGFVSGQPDPDRPDDLPLVAVKPYDTDTLWAWGSDTGHAYGGANQEAFTWFVSREPGTWQGWIDIPTTVDRDGPDDDGRHWFRVLCGAFSTTGGSEPFVGNVCSAPITFRVYYSVVDRDPIGVTGPDGSTFQAGTTFRVDGAVTPRLTELPASRPIQARLDDGAPFDVTAAGQPAQTTPAGAIPPDARAVIPADAAPGPHRLTFSVAPASGPAVITTYDVMVTAPPTAAITTAVVRPGGTISVALTGYVGVGGTGQKVAVVAGSQVLACITTSSAGAATTLVAIPSSTPVGSLALTFAAGTSCQGPTGAQNDLPASVLTGTTEVKADAPDATAAPTPTPVATPTPAPAPAPAPTVVSPPTATPVPSAAPAPVARAPRSATLKGSTLTLTFPSPTTKGTKITVTSSAKVRLAASGRAKTVTLARATVGASGRVAVKLTADGRKALRRYRTLRVNITVAVPGSRKTATRTVTLRA